MGRSSGSPSSLAMGSSRSAVVGQAGRRRRGRRAGRDHERGGARCGSSSRRSVSCAARTRSCGGRRLSSGRSSTASSADSRVHRRNKDDVVDGRRLGVEPICRVLQVAQSTYYAARDRPLSVRAQRDAELMPRLVELWKANYEVYGVRKLWKAARRAGIEIGRDQTARLMRQAGIRGALRSQAGQDHAPGPPRRAASRSRQPSVQRPGAERAVGDRPDVRGRPGPGWPTSASSSTRSAG